MADERLSNQLKEVALDRLKRAIVAKETAVSGDLEENIRLDDELRRASLDASNLNIPHLEITRTYLDALSQASPEAAQRFFNEILGDQDFDRQTFQKLAQEFNLKLPPSPTGPDCGA